MYGCARPSHKALPEESVLRITWAVLLTDTARNFACTNLKPEVTLFASFPLLIKYHDFFVPFLKQALLPMAMHVLRFCAGGHATRRI